MEDLGIRALCTVTLVLATLAGTVYCIDRDDYNTGIDLNTRNTVQAPKSHRDDGKKYSVLRSTLKTHQLFNFKIQSILQ